MRAGEGVCDGGRVSHLKGKCTQVSSTPQGFPGDSVVKNPSANAGNAGSIPGQEDPLEEDMETHSSILAWKIPRTEKPGGLQSMGSQS